jgi:hypothetical protein
VEALRKRALATDANDMLYQFEASMDYNPSPLLETIKAPLYAVNAADDEVNPPELGLLDREIKRVPRGRYIQIPTGDETRGHGTQLSRGLMGAVFGGVAQGVGTRPSRGLPNGRRRAGHRDRDTRSPVDPIERRRILRTRAQPEAIPSRQARKIVPRGDTMDTQGAV